MTVGALHQIDFAALRSAASAWHDVFAPLPKPLLVVNIGGPTSEFFQSIGLSYLVLIKIFPIHCFLLIFIFHRNGLFHVYLLVIIILLYPVYAFLYSGGFSFCFLYYDV